MDFTVTVPFDGETPVQTGVVGLCSRSAPPFNLLPSLTSTVVQDEMDDTWSEIFGRQRGVPETT